MVMPMARVVAHKFGGTSVADAERIRHVADVLLARPDERQVIVVSAMKGVTDGLIALVQNAARGDASWAAELGALAERHRAAVHALFGDQAPEGLEAFFEREFARVAAMLETQAAIGAVSTDLLQLISGLGEIWSSRMLDEHLRGRGAASLWLDARELLVVVHDPLGAQVDWPATRAALAARAEATEAPRVVLPGFVARTADGRATTLGRNGSDYSGAIFGALFEAAEIHIWTDVDGVLSADPRFVPQAILIERMSYAEACELAYFGAKVVHPQTMAPAIQAGIPIVIRNTFAPDKPGSWITKEGDPRLPIKGVTTFGGLAILNVEGAGMIGVPGTAERAFAALRQIGASVIMVSQGSSEHSICVVVQERDAAAAREALQSAFERELGSGRLLSVSCASDVAALAVVGDGMVGTRGVASRLFQALARSGVNVRAIAQGASERNISVAFAASDAPRALRAVHAAFYLSPRALSLGILGCGNVGKAFARQLDEVRARLLEERGIDVRVRALASSKRMALRDPPLHGGGAGLDELAAAQAPLELDRFVDHVQTDHFPHAVLVDCTASDEVTDRYAGWIRRGIHVVSANKHAGSGRQERYREIRQALRGGGGWRYSTTCGAGLPIIQTLRDLLDTGDEVVAIEGVFSGTLAYIFSNYDGSEPFSALVRAARELGFTEPDPRDDLSGRDVARKLVILAREAGLPVAMADVALEGLVPAALREVPTASFLERLGELDAAMLTRLGDAQRRQMKLRYVARLDAEGKVTVGLTELVIAHPFSNSRPTDNIVQFTTRRYRDNPLVVQGPGAGPEVTAAGLTADLLRLCASLGS
jgi:aspartokinase/homoserine dehydrogenase 1